MQTQWHWGKLVLLWLICLIMAWFSYVLLDNGAGLPIGLVWLAVLVLAPLYAVVTTWKWFGAREKH